LRASHTIMQVILATTHDTKALLHFAQATFVATYAHLNEPLFFEQYVSAHFTAEIFEKELTDSQIEFWLIKENNDILAYNKLNINRLHDAQTITKPTDGSMMELERIYVAESQKGKGLGKILIEKALERAAFYACDWLWLGVWEKNERALGFYETMGFETFGSHYFYMGDDAQNDFLMRKKTLKA
jgi:diamine N-acetyltransferase